MFPVLEHEQQMDLPQGRMSKKESRVRASFLEVLEKLWNLILDFKGAWKALEKKNFYWKCLKIMKTPWILVQMGNDAGVY